MEFILTYVAILLTNLLYPLTISATPPLANNNCQQAIALIRNHPETTSQVIMVKAFDHVRANVTLCQRQGKQWQPILPTFKAIIGKSGITPKEQKREGDLKTPTGLYRLKKVFGSKPLAVKMNYNYITDEDKYIDDVNSKHYNHWIHGKTIARSYEPMLVDAYKMGIIVEYNKNPIIPGAGSAIFMHIWQSPDTPTSGCIATDEHSLLATLQWLDKGQHPYIFIYS